MLTSERGVHDETSLQAARTKATVLTLNVCFELLHLVDQLKLQEAASTKLITKELQLRSYNEGNILGYVRNGSTGPGLPKIYNRTHLAAVFFQQKIKPLTWRMSWCFLFDKDILDIMDKWFVAHFIR